MANNLDLIGNNSTLVHQESRQAIQGWKCHETAEFITVKLTLLVRLSTSDQATAGRSRRAREYASGPTEDQRGWATQAKARARWHAATVPSGTEGPTRHYPQEWDEDVVSSSRESALAAAYELAEKAESDVGTARGESEAVSLT